MGGLANSLKRLNRRNRAVLNLTGSLVVPASKITKSPKQKRKSKRKRKKKLNKEQTKKKKKPRKKAEAVKGKKTNGNPRKMT